MNSIETATPAPTHPDVLAALLAEAAPNAGPLTELEFDHLSPTGRIDAILAWEHLVRHAQAGLIRCLGTLTHTPAPAHDAHPHTNTPTSDAHTHPHTPTTSVDTHPAVPAREALNQDWLVESELSAALAWPPSTIQTRLTEAHALVHLFPQTLQLLSQGHIALEQARSLAQLTHGLPDTTAHAVQTHVLPRMPGQSLPLTRQAIRRAILRTDPTAAETRHHHQRQQRRVELHPDNDGMAWLNFHLPADTAHMAMHTLTTLAQSAKRTNPTDTRTLDQHRADLLPTLLLHPTPGSAPGAPITPAHITVVVGIDTLLRLSNEPGHLTGHGPITPEHTRTLAHTNAARWRFLLTATNGTPIHTSPTYTPRAALQHLTRLTHTTCAFPNCHMPANRCDLDHNTPYADGGPTTLDNLTPLCRRHHNHKTRGEWTLTRQGDTITWTSTHTGRTYTTTPTRYQPHPVTT